MRAADIAPGGDYLLVVHIPKVARVPLAARQERHAGAVGFPGCRVTRRVTVIESSPAGVLVEADEWVATLDPDIPKERESAAILEGGHLTWQRTRRRWTVPARRILRPAPARKDTDQTTAARHERWAA